MHCSSKCVYGSQGARNGRCSGMVRRIRPGRGRAVGIARINKRKTTTPPGTQVIEGRQSAILVRSSVNNPAVRKYNISFFNGLSGVTLNGECSTTVSKLQDLNDARKAICQSFSLRLHISSQVTCNSPICLCRSCWRLTPPFLLPVS